MKDFSFMLYDKENFITGYKKKASGLEVIYPNRKENLVISDVKENIVFLESTLEKEYRIADGMANVINLKKLIAIITALLALGVGLSTILLAAPGVLVSTILAMGFGSVSVFSFVKAFKYGAIARDVKKYRLFKENKDKFAQVAETSECLQNTSKQTKSITKDKVFNQDISYNTIGQMSYRNARKIVKNVEQINRKTKPMVRVRGR